jgi:hypothetical protein
MIDYVKLDISFDSKYVLQNKDLSFYTPFNKETGESKRWKTAEFKNMIFISKGSDESYMEVQGSLHKYLNEGKHNYNDFCYSELAATIMDFCCQFGINPKEARIQNLEFGVNLIVPFNPTPFLKNNIINFKGQSKSRSGPIEGKGYYIQFEKTNYIVKIYDKGSQYCQEENILRVEVKTKKMNHIKSTGIKTLADLSDLSKVKKLVPILKTAFEGLLIFDPIDSNKLESDETEMYLNGINSLYWENLKSNSHDPLNKRPRKKYYRELSEFNNLLRKYNLDHTKLYLSKLIDEKCNQLLLTDDNTTNQLTHFLTKDEYCNSGYDVSNWTTIKLSSIDPEKGQNHPLRDRGICTPHKDGFPDLEKDD